MKKSVLLAVVGAAALVGCRNEVMTERKYVPATGENPAGNGAPVVEVAPATMPKVAAAAPAKAPAATHSAGEFSPMGETHSSAPAAVSAPAAKGGEYTVRPGDTMGKIAAINHVRLSALMQANGMTEKDAKRLRVGKKLIIPGASGSVAAVSGKKYTAGKSGAAKSVRHAAKAGKASIKPGEYTVKSGDTPERIARRSGISLSALMQANNMTPAAARRLRVGQKLTIPGSGAAVAPAAQNTAATPAAPAATDSLEAEMNKAQVTEQAPAAAPAAQSAPVQSVTPATAGSVPAVPETAAAPSAVTETEVVEVTEDIAVSDFAKKYNTTVEFLLKENADIKGDKLTKGALVFVPKK